MNRFIALRYRKGITQTQLVEATGISRGTIYNLEQGGTPSPPIAKKLAEFYELPMSQVLGLEPLAADEREAA
ncbi:MAG: Helix-turn-helix domain [Acidimicrobiales bacterium]|nr:Helix-turn-helix domain [Acidimicrobiales bacterium]